jgi:tRNA (pseudouridine54-N1)-methyltransferase
MTQPQQISTPSAHARIFILKARTARTDGNFDILQLPKAGRLEVVCGCITNALWISSNLRKDTLFHIVLEGPPRPPLIVTIDGSTLKEMDFFETAIAQVLKKVLNKPVTNIPQEFHPGITVHKSSIESLIRTYCNTHKVYLLSDEGEDCQTVTFEQPSVFVFGDYIGLPKQSRSLFSRLGLSPISIGPVTVFASQCITIIHNQLDRQQHKKKVSQKAHITTQDIQLE